ncbi:MAG: class I SAM-dependent methyltransferase [Candidatus Omnitrophota bacterium]
MYEPDFKKRWGGLLENPWISKIQRDILDGGRNHYLKQILSRYQFTSVLDIGCGLGETSEAVSGDYTGVDNSLPRIRFASRQYPSRTFLIGDAQHLMFKENSFDAGLLIDTSHHFSDDLFVSVLKEMTRICAGYLVVSDPVCFEGQSFLSRYFYSLDRGGRFRSIEEMQRVFAQVLPIEYERLSFFTAFPGLYRHAVFVFKLEKP